MKNIFIVIIKNKKDNVENTNDRFNIFLINFKMLEILLMI